LIRLSASQVKSTSEVVARAFHSDPLMSHYFPDETERKQLLPPLYQFVLRYGTFCSEAYVTSPNLEGVALWLPPQETSMPLWKIPKAGALSLAFTVKLNALLKLWPLFRTSEKARKRHAPFPHWYLFLIAVEPSYQGKGYASALLKPMLAHMDSERLPCYLETTEERNVSIYEHYGFRVAEVSKIPNTDIDFWAMLRDEAA